MPRRTVLFSPGDRPEMLRKAVDTGTDVAVFDLEDAVAPADRAGARRTVREVLTDPDFESDPDVEVCVRVSPERDADLDAILGPPSDPDPPGSLDAVVLPKASGGDDVRALAEACATRGADLPVLALCETAVGVTAAAEIAAAEPTTALLFGAEDLAADLGAVDPRGRSCEHARERVLIAARSAGVDAVDAVYTAIDDPEGLRADVRAGADLGYGGKMVVHPSQVPVVHEAIAPDEERVEWARRILEADAASDGGVVRIDGEMVDAPLVRRAVRILERAGRRPSD